MTVTLHRAAAGLGALEPAWWDLWRRIGATPFHSPAWLLPWAGTFCPETALAVAQWRGERLAGLMPLFALDDRLLALGAGTTDHLGPLLSAGADVTALLDALPASRTLEFPDQPQDSPLLALPVQRTPGRPCPVLALPGLPRHMAQNVRTARNRAVREAGGWQAALADDGEAAFAVLADLHARRWGERGEAGVLADPRVRAFHHAAMPRLAAAGLLRLVTLALGGGTAAVLYGLAAHGTFHHYIAGFDPALSFFSPGLLVIAAAVDRAVADGCGRFDFLRGAEDYKYRWGARDEGSVALVFERRQAGAPAAPACC